MACLYMQVASYEDYKFIERQMKEFNETIHDSHDGFYHCSIRLKVSEDLTIEFHGPLVKAATKPIHSE